MMKCAKDQQFKRNLINTEELIGMRKYKAYSSYKDSGVEWFPDMPFEWDSAKVKYLFAERVQKGFPNEPLLAATQSNGVIRKDDYKTHTVTAQKDFHLLKLVKVGDFVISLRSFQGGIEICYQQGIISPAYTVMIPSKNVDENFYKYLLKSKYFINGLTTFVTGIREGQNIDYSKFRRSLLPVPPSKEQTAIANFLDKKTVEIKEFIRLKEKTIELLKERKTAIINELVTGKKVWDGNAWAEPVEVKDSGIEWLGEIPKHWEVKKLKYLAKVCNGHDQKEVINENGEYNIYGSGGVFGRTNSYLYEGPSVLLGRKGTIDKPMFVTDPFWSVDTAFYTIIRKNMSPKFFFYLAKSISFDKYIYGSAIPSMTQSILNNIQFAIPGYIEQKNIVNTIDRIFSNLDKSISQAQQEITLIKEYQQSLISEAVTGKIDVSTSSTEL